jgi:sugar/nucleoside kinase (ribokinase family)
MTSGSPSRRLDLLVMGGLTVDRFTDGSAAPGGAVLHIARALATHGVIIGIVTTAGPEPEAQAGLAELRRLAAAVDATSSEASITFGHTETKAGRELVLERRGGTLPVPADAGGARALLFAPVSVEIPVEALAARRGAVGGAVLQGWVRSTDEGMPVAPRSITAIGAEMAAALGAMDLVIGSSEDLRADGADALAQLAAVRTALGDRPALVVTDGARGPWLDDGSGPRHLPMARQVDGVSTIGAGDMFAAIMLLALAGSGGADPEAAAALAMERVTEVLLGRRSV